MSLFHRSDCMFDIPMTFRWAWESWRMAVGPQIFPYFVESIRQYNIGAQNAGYNDISKVWIKEFEIPDLPIVMTKLWNDVKHFYTLLHGVLRNILRSKYIGIENFDREDLIPAHILGNMWAQNWVTYTDLIIPFNKVNLDENIAKSNWTTIDMVKRAEDFYASLGLGLMTKKFWETSVFEMNDNLTNCHGTAANMFDREGNFRMLVCPRKSVNDFYVIHHEMGHIQYYMTMSNQPPIFQDGTNSALQESIGDAIFYGVMVPQHLNRLRLIPDEFLFPEKQEKMDKQFLKMVHSQGYESTEYKELDDIVLDNDIKPIIKFFDKDFPKISEINRKRKTFDQFTNNFDNSINKFDIYLLLRTALAKIPQIPFEYIIDIFRWSLSDGHVKMTDANKYFWELIEQEQGIRPPDWENRNAMFDAGAKFHVANNIPYARYFLASFIQTQIFRGLCEVTVFGQLNQKKDLPMPLHRCDIYGSKRAGKLLK